MADPPDKKVLKATQEDDGNVDRLSALPDCVLLYILSRFCFYTKSAAATSVLSKRWRNLFVLLPEIDLYFFADEDVSDRDRLYSDFINFTNRVIRQRNEAPIRRIRLVLSHFSERHRMLFEWLLISVAAAFSLSIIQELEILIVIDRTTKPLSISVPPEIFTCKTLVSLSLKLGVYWTVPDLVCLPNLKVLGLDMFKLVDEACIGKFLQGCPLLEQLELSMRPFNHERDADEHIEVNFFKISSPVLKRVILCFQGVESEFTTVVESNSLEHLSFLLDGQHKVAIDAPNLRSLKLHGDLLEVDIIQNLISLDNALLEIDFLCHMRTRSAIISCSERAFKFFRGLQNVKSISFSESFLIALYFSQRVLPTFRNLIKLQLDPFDCPAFPRECMSSILSSLFESSPNLEVLIFSEVSYNGHLYCTLISVVLCSPLCTSNAQVSKNYFSKDEELNSVFHEALPLVLVECLKEIEIGNFKGEEHELKLVEFFLESGKSLKKMTLFGYAGVSLSKGLDRILSFKKCSDDCQIVSKEQWNWLFR
ncbi:F-box protein At4g22280 isoform X1 [Coffea arabica]|uniref:F-box protein At4g22280 isoform X1 n=1 Tax=Coffea arabica TaxID=13443 RepID=A0ABM4X704_COFAR